MLSRSALDALEAYAWPGNVRELRNFMERAVLLAEGPDVNVEHLPMEILGAPLALVVDPEPAGGLPVPASPNHSDDDARDRWNRAEREERARIVSVLESTGGNQSRAAKALSISRGTLIARLKYYDIRRPRDTPASDT